ncbi:hypothetical protein D7Y13_17895 [Corallococcus praedator]|uniref:Hyalin n=1 Tax=Corallococcus praedator TaxID=2316724 RepID=A0ABX9QGL9_9BACT|nr:MULTISPECIES: ELWxxDGT repeat protein [Corallococcus]RKH27990.1 hypothetical protein D7X75_25470 [Corallococcus sp. CA031C]RKI07403.1 hypothetical protein D7Y13_17895 [Corallococcus praedator]
MGERGRRQSLLGAAVSVLALGGCGGVALEDEAGPTASLAPAVHASADPWVPCGDLAERVRDIRPGMPGSSPGELVRGTNVLVFSADDGVTGREPWFSTGERSGTKLAKDLRAGASGSNPSSFTVLGSTVFFVADDGVVGRELWKTDGTSAGTLRVRDIRPGALGSAPENLTVYAGKLYFTADDGVHGRELWRSDGTTAQTTRVTGLLPPGTQGSTYTLAVAGTFLYVGYYVHGPSLDRLYLVRTDGTPGGLVRLADAPEDNSFGAMVAVGSRLFFLQNNDEPEWGLHVTDGTVAGTRKLREFPAKPHDLVAFGGRLYFASGPGAYDPPDYQGDELWRSDGTTEGTKLVRDLRPGAQGSEPRELTVFQNRLFFTADNGVHGRELWRSDGFSTVMASDLEPGAVGAAPEGLAGHGTRLFFSANTTGRGREPWMFDEFLLTMTPLVEIAPGPASSSPGVFVRSGWDLFFAANDGVTGRELWALSFRPPEACLAVGLRR